MYKQVSMVKKPGPDTPSKAQACLYPKLKLIHTLLGGTEAMRDAGRDYLPKHSREYDDDYAERLSVSVLTNFFEQTLTALASKPFTKQPKVEVGNEMLDEMLDDVDLQGNDLQVFMRNWFKDGYAAGRSNVLVDFPRVEPRADGQPRTLEDDQRDNLRPYAVLICETKVLGRRYSVVNGVRQLSQVRILEEYEIESEWGEVCKPQVKVLEPGLVKIYRKQSDKSREWIVAEQWETALDFIPFFTFSPDPNATEDHVKPPLLDLAYLNVLHWQSSSDQRNILTTSRFPILAASGLDNDQAGNVEFGPRRLLTTADSQGRFYYVEHTGASIAAGQADIEALEQQMSMYGATQLTKKPGGYGSNGGTATAKALDTAEAVSPLQCAVGLFEDAVESMILAMAAWLKLDGIDPEVELFKEFSLSTTDQFGLDALNKARERKDISRAAFLGELKRRNILSQEYDPETDQEMLDEEPLNGGTETDIDQGAQTTGNKTTPPEGA